MFLINKYARFDRHEMLFNNQPFQIQTLNKCVRFENGYDFESKHEQ